MHSIGLPQQTSAPEPATVTSTSLPQILHLYLCPAFVILLPPVMITSDFSQLCVYLFEHVLARPAERTRPVIRKVLESSSGRYLPLPVPFLRVIDISAVRSLTLPHNIFLLLDCIRSLFLTSAPDAATAGLLLPSCIRDTCRRIRHGVRE